MRLKFNEIVDLISFCLNIILREARKEERLVKQIFYTMLSTYTNNPYNLAINSPSGEGKTYVLHKVGEKFPNEDVMFLAEMTDKPLFHRQGILVINDVGEYEPIDENRYGTPITMEKRQSALCFFYYYFMLPIYSKSS